jgi:hypothetical protein
MGQWSTKILTSTAVSMCCLSLAERRVEYDHVLGVSQAIVMVSNRLNYFSELYILEIFDSDRKDSDKFKEAAKLYATRRFASDRSFPSCWKRSHCFIVRIKHLDIVFKPVCCEDLINYKYL